MGWGDGRRLTAKSKGKPLEVMELFCVLIVVVLYDCIPLSKLIKRVILLYINQPAFKEKVKASFQHQKLSSQI